MGNNNDQETKPEKPKKKEKISTALYTYNNRLRGRADYRFDKYYPDADGV